MANMRIMEIILRLLTTIIGVSIGVFISNSIFRLLDRQKTKQEQKDREERAAVMQSNVDFIDEINSESHIQADIQTLRKFSEKEN